MELTIEDVQRLLGRKEMDLEAYRKRVAELENEIVSLRAEDAPPEVAHVQA